MVPCVVGYPSPPPLRFLVLWLYVLWVRPGLAGSYADDVWLFAVGSYHGGLGGPGDAATGGHNRRDPWSRAIYDPSASLRPGGEP